MAYRALDAAMIIGTLQRLERRIAERFPGSGLLAVGADLLGLAEKTQSRAEGIAVPNRILRLMIYVAIAIGVAGLVVAARFIQLRIGNLEAFQFFQGVEAAINLVVIVSAALFFAITIEDRIKRRRALAALHEIRSIAHVIDMHQLTKDPSLVLHPAEPTQSSPRRSLTRFELSRYLDYCSEMLALCGKLAALYAQSLPDPVVIAAVNDIEQLTADLSLKIWQKIAILEAHGAVAG